MKLEPRPLMGIFMFCVARRELNGRSAAQAQFVVGLPNVHQCTRGDQKVLQLDTLDWYIRRHVRFKLLWVRDKYTFYWCIESEKFFSSIYRVARLFDRPSYQSSPFTMILFLSLHTFYVYVLFIKRIRIYTKELTDGFLIIVIIVIIATYCKNAIWIVCKEYTAPKNVFALKRVFTCTWAMDVEHTVWFWRLQCVCNSVWLLCHCVACQQRSC